MADMENFFALAQDDQRLILLDMQSKLGVSASILEKDVWLCLVLEKLFQLPNAKPMAFKGGTSLSKIYRAIERFSEDIDVTVDWEQLHPKPPQHEEIEKLSKGKTKELAEEINAGLQRYIGQFVLPGLAMAVKDETGMSAAYETDEDGNEVKDKLRIYYPAVTEQVDYVAQSILIEFGAKNAIEPIEEHVISPDIAEHVPAVYFQSAKVHVLSPLRTFWEKVTLIHDECIRPADKARRNFDRLSRHWYDLARLADHEIGPKAIENMELLEHVIQIKKRFYSYRFSQYDLCRTGDLRLVPDGEILSALRVDYAKMVEANMFYGNKLTFEEIVNRLTLLTTEINSLAASTSKSDASRSA